MYEQTWLKMMKAKLGIFGEEDKDLSLIQNLLNWMQVNKADYTNTFCYLMDQRIGNREIYEEPTFLDWYKEWKGRLSKGGKSEDEILSIMKSANPIIIPRNHKIEEALKDAESKDDFSKLKDLLKFLETPYSFQEGINNFQEPAGIGYEEYRTFCGT